jgi:hypothetical protein
MPKTEEMIRPGTVVVAALAGAVVGFALGVYVMRDPKVMERWARRAGELLAGWKGAAAGAQEGLARHWADAKERAHEAMAAGTAVAEAAATEPGEAATRRKGVRRPARKPASRAGAGKKRTGAKR